MKPVYQKCPECNGQKYTLTGGNDYTMPCTTCHGAGERLVIYCEICNATLVVGDTKPLAPWVCNPCRDRLGNSQALVANIVETKNLVRRVRELEEENEKLRARVEEQKAPVEASSTVRAMGAMGRALARMTLEQADALATDMTPLAKRAVARLFRELDPPVHEAADGSCCAHYHVPDPTFVCSVCKRRVGWCLGNGDEHLDKCNDCWAELPPEEKGG